MSTTAPRTVWVLGNDVSRSRSPKLHNAIYRAEGLPWTYASCSTDSRGLIDFLRALWRHRAVGCNLTAPFKEEAYRYLLRGRDGKIKLDLSPLAMRLGSVNTIKVTPTGLIGYSTDGAGWWCAFCDRFGADAMQRQRVLLLGAGGAARALLPVFLEHGARRVDIVNRTAERAEALISALGDERCFYCGPRWKVENGYPNIVVQATPCRSSEDLDRFFSWEGFPAQTVACDLLYGAEPTAFLHQAIECGLKWQDGSGMLEGQAKAAIDIWRERI